MIVFSQRDLKDKINIKAKLKQDTTIWVDNHKDANLPQEVKVQSSTLKHLEFVSNQIFSPKNENWMVSTFGHMSKAPQNISDNR